VPALKDLLNRLTGRAAAPAAPAEAAGTPAERLLAGDWVPSTSPQLELVRYLADEQKLFIQYPGGVVWSYDPYTEAEVRAFAAGGFRMTWVWDHVKVRGTRDRHQRNARLEAFH
jgi:hypothetical protein